MKKSKNDKIYNNGLKSNFPSYKWSNSCQRFQTFMETKVATI